MQSTVCKTVNPYFKYNNKAFLHFQLKDNTNETILNVLKEIRNMTVIFKQDGTPIYNINMHLNMILMKEYDQYMTVIDVESLKLQYGEETLNDMVYKTIDNKVILNSKYIFDDNGKYYLDVPLLEEFYAYGRKMSTLLYHGAQYIIQIIVIELMIMNIIK